MLCAPVSLLSPQQLTTRPIQAHLLFSSHLSEFWSGILTSPQLSLATVSSSSILSSESLLYLSRTPPCPRGHQQSQVLARGHPSQMSVPHDSCNLQVKALRLKESREKGRKPEPGTWLFLRGQAPLRGDFQSCTLFFLRRQTALVGAFRLLW